MRLKVKLTIQREVLNGAILQQSFVVEYVVERHMCVQCNRQAANPNSWTACVQVRSGGVGPAAARIDAAAVELLGAAARPFGTVAVARLRTRTPPQPRQQSTQCPSLPPPPPRRRLYLQVRQHVPHKRTFFLLEQLILKHGADDPCVNVRRVHEGLDFYFASRSGANKFVDFLGAVVPVKHRSDKQLVSHDVHTSTYNFKFTFSVEIAPLCKVREGRCVGGWGGKGVWGGWVGGGGVCVCCACC
jgi:hypothetical protein